jgi:hypothetical protein
MRIGIHPPPEEHHDHAGSTSLGRRLRHGDARRSHGATGHRVLRDGNDLLVLLEFPDSAAAQSFQSDPSLREALAHAGIQGAPDICLRSEAELVRY